jgi:iron complex outermembrane receptor protein
MLFNDEIVKQGQIDRFGQPVTGNMDRTIHYGVEMSASSRLDEYIDLIVNGSLSKNYISRGEVFVSTGDPGKPFRIDLSSNRISGFPDITFNTIIKYSRDNILFQASIKYVGEFRTDNYDNKLGEYRRTVPQIAGYFDNKVDPYFVSNIFASYSFNLEPVSREFQIFLQINNVFDNLYAAYGIGGEFFPAAERNFNFGVKLSM